MSRHRFVASLCAAAESVLWKRGSPPRRACSTTTTTSTSTSTVSSTMRQGQAYVSSGSKGMKWVDERMSSRFSSGNILAGLLLGTGAVSVVWAFWDPDNGRFERDVAFSNWSGTHSIQCKKVYEPETEEEVVHLMRRAIGEGWLLRVVGSGISPNALGFSDKCLISMAQMDKVLNVDVNTKQVRVQAGAKVQDVVEALRPYDLTLQNFASVREQQIGGFTQVSAHGTGAALPPVDEQVLSMRLVSPGLGQAVELQRGKDAAFEWAKVGLGSMGVVTEVTIQCVDAHRLLEETTVTNRRTVERNHQQWLAKNKHLRYMWIPYTDTVVVVKCNETKNPETPKPGMFTKVHSEAEKLQPMRALLQTTAADVQGVEDMTATQLRDALLAADPLNQQWIIQVNTAEAEFWKRNSGYRVGWSDEILGFDCGGQQWVLEVAFPTAGEKHPSGKPRDLAYIADLMKLIEENEIAAPAPIEQRWSASSAAPLSPAHSSVPTDVHSWVGVIMYMPTDDAETRQQITQAFERYSCLCEELLMPVYDAKWHWAKLETDFEWKGKGSEFDRLEWVRQYLRDHYDVSRFNHVRRTLDPQNNLGNQWLNDVLPLMR